jgi:adenylate cyclase
LLTATVSKRPLKGGEINRVRYAANINGSLKSAPATSARSDGSAIDVIDSKTPRLSMVVLPFANLSNDPDQEYLADGITEDLTTDLSGISGRFVIARNTAFTYKGKPIDAQQIGRELGVRYVLEGSVRRTGDRVRVNTQLINAENGAYIWADRIDTDRFNLAETQDEITGRLARTLDFELAGELGRRIERESPAKADSRRSRYARTGVVVSPRIGSESSRGKAAFPAGFGD